MVISTLFGNTIKQASKTKTITNGSPEREKDENHPKLKCLHKTPLHPIITSCSDNRQVLIKLDKITEQRLAYMVKTEEGNFSYH